MGWLELLPLLKRLLPLLSRMAPMLETFVAVRAANGKDTEATLSRVATSMRHEFGTEFTEAAESRALVAKTLATQSEHLRTMHVEVERLRVATGDQDARMEGLEAQLTGLVRSLKTYALTVLLLLILCTTLLVAIFFRH